MLHLQKLYVIVMSDRIRVMTEKEFHSQIWSLKDKIYRYAFAILGNREDAEDICQEIFKRLWEECHQFYAAENRNAYVMKMVRNLCIDHIRKERLHEERLEMLYSDTDISYLQQEDLKDMGNLLRKIIGNIPEKYGTVLHLRDVEGYAMEEIAKITDTDVATTRVILSRARKIVREKLEKLMNYGL